MATTTIGDPSLRAMQRAEELFMAGEFTASESQFRRLARHEAVSDADAQYRLGCIALLRNDIATALDRLTAVLRAEPHHLRACAQLAEVYYRARDFAAAAAMYKTVGRQARARQLEAFNGQAPYRLVADVEETEIDWSGAHPLPVISAEVDGMAANLLIDTGAGELVLDRSFAETIGAEQFGSEINAFGGGKTGATGYGRANLVRLGGFVMQNVPAQLRNLELLAERYVGNTPIHGIIGTSLLYHFIPTLDYPNQRLHLRCRTSGRGKSELQPACGGAKTVIPFWLAGSHHVIVRGDIGDHSTLLFLDTGATGTDVALAPSTLQTANLRPNYESGSRRGLGGAGTVSAASTPVDSVTLGRLTRHSLDGVVLENFPLERRLGFHIGGLLTHEFFRDHTLTLDFRRMSLRICHAHTAASRLSS